MFIYKNHIKKVIFIFGIAQICCQIALSQGTTQRHLSNIDYIDPTIGTVAPLLNTNRPVVLLPNQMIRVFPKRQDHLDMQITDFPLTALNIITPQMVFAIKPSKGEVNDTGWYRRMTYDHDFEVTRPWYYSTILTDDDIRMEFTAGKKCGIYRFTFPAGVRKNLLLSHYYENGDYQITNSNIITGREFVNDAIHQQKGIVYMYGVFSGNPESGKKEGEKDWGKYTVGGTPEKPKKMNGERAWFSYSPNDDLPLGFRYAISFICLEQAKKNFENELKSVSFDQPKEKGKESWDKVIKQIKVEGGTESQKRTFYTALYRCYARMVSMSEDRKYFSAYDNKVHEDKREFYTDDYSWGNYLALHPLHVIIDSKREADMLQSYVDAYRKGVRNFDINKALEGNIKNEEQATLLPFRNGPQGDLEKFYNKNGYYPALHPGESETDSFASLKHHQVRSSVAVTLGDSYDSWAVSELAKELNKAAIHQRYSTRAQNYKNLWWDQYNMFMPKDAKGNWIEIDPKFDGGPNGFDYYNENNGWTYMWNGHQDIKGLRELMGGADKMELYLYQLFREGMGRSKPEFWAKFPNQTGMIGQFSIGNQASFFIPYLFNYTNAAWKTQKYTRLILDTWFKDNLFGVPSDEDGGSMSSFVVFTAMGFFPVTPGLPIYSVTSPCFNKVSINLANGRKFELIAKNNSPKNKYIQAATINGKVLSSLSFTHEELVKGGTLVLEMGEVNSKKWNIQ